MSNTLDQITTIIRDLFDNYGGPVHRGLVAADVRQWDSLGNVQLMVAVEQNFGVRFATAEIRKFANLGDLIEAIDKKQAAR